MGLGFVVYYLLKHPEKLRNNTPYITLIRKNIHVFGVVLRQFVVVLCIKVVRYYSFLRRPLANRLPDGKAGPNSVRV